MDFFFFLPTTGMRKGKVQKKTEKITNVSLYVYMSAGNSEMLVFLSVFFPNNEHFSCFLMVAWEKNRKNVCFYGVCMYECKDKTNIC